MAKNQVAVEITEESVRAVELTRGRTPVLVTAGEVALPPGAAKDSEILDRDAVAMALQRLWAEARFSTRDVVLGVGNRRILVREHATTLTDPALIRQALPYEVQDRLPVPVDQAVLDFVPTAQNSEGVQGLLVAAVAEHMEELVGALEKARLRATSVDLVAFGHARALATLTPPGTTALHLGIGEHTTHIVIATGGVPRFVRVVPIDIVAPVDANDADRAGDETLPPAVSGVDERMPPAGADDALGALLVGVEARPVGAAAVAVAPRPPGTRAERRGRSARPIDAPPPAATPATETVLHPDVQAALIDLVGRLRSTVTFYRDRPEAVPIDTVYVSGVHSAHPRLLESIRRVTGTPVIPVSAVDLVRPGPRVPALPPAVNARLASTVSLLLGGIS